MRLTFFIFIFLFFNSLMANPVRITLPAQNGNWSEVSCQIREYSPKTPYFSEQDNGVCSGTYIAPNVFLTAAHCLVSAGLGGVLSEVDKKRFYITCPHARTAGILAGYIHPDFIMVNSDHLNEQKELITNRISAESIKNRDLAVLITDDIHFTQNFPTVVTEEAQLQRIIKNNWPCSMLAYSSLRCDPLSGTSCLRPYHYSKTYGELIGASNSDDFNYGDSGGGVLCIGPDQKNYLISVYTTKNFAKGNSEYGAVLLFNYNNFLKEFLEKSKNQIIEENRSIEFSADFSRKLVLFRNLFRFFKSYSKDKMMFGCEDKYLRCEGTLQSLEIVLGKEDTRTEFLNYLKQKSIRGIYILKDPSERSVWNGWNPTQMTLTDASFLMIRPNASV